MTLATDQADTRRDSSAAGCGRRCHETWRSDGPDLETLELMHTIREQRQEADALLLALDLIAQALHSGARDPLTKARPVLARVGIEPPASWSKSTTRPQRQQRIGVAA